MEHEFLTNYSEGDSKITDMKQMFSFITNKFKQRWLAAHKTRGIFEENNAELLNIAIDANPLQLLLFFASYIAYSAYSV